MEKIKFTIASKKRNRSNWDEKPSFISYLDESYRITEVQQVKENVEYLVIIKKDTFGFWIKYFGSDLEIFKKPYKNIRIKHVWEKNYGGEKTSSKAWIPYLLDLVN